MRGVFVSGVEQVELREVANPVRQAGQVLLSVDMVGICGSDIHVYRGIHPRVKPPHCYVSGHEAVATVVDVDEGAAVQKGDLVVIIPLVACKSCPPCLNGYPQRCYRRHCLGFQQHGTMAEYICLPEENVLKIDPKTSLVRASMLEPLVVGEHAVGLSQWASTSPVLIVGAGMIGLSIGAVLRGNGHNKIIFLEKNPNRRQLLDELGFENVDDFDLLPKDQLLVAFECSGSPVVFQRLIDLQPPLLEVVIVATYEREERFSLFSMARAETIFRGAQMYQPVDWHQAALLLEDSRVTEVWDKAVAGVLPLERVGDAFARARAAQGIKQLLAVSSSARLCCTE